MSPKEFLSQLTVMTIAVIDEEGKPWAVPVKIQTYQNGEITWVSKTTTVHSRAIVRSPEIMVNAFDEAAAHFRKAIELAELDSERELLASRVELCASQSRA